MEPKNPVADRSSSSIARILRHPVATAESRESVALLGGAAMFVVGTLVSLLVYRGDSLPISGPGSLGQFVALGAGIVTIAFFILGRVLASAHGASKPIPDATPFEGMRWFDLAALGLAHVLIAVLGWLTIASLFSRSFIDAVVFPFSASVLTGVALALTAFAVFLSAIHLTPLRVSLILALFLVLGIFTAMLSASDPHWWKENLSALGMTDDLSSKAFNITLIISGVLVTTIAHIVTLAIPAKTQKEIRGRKRIGFALALIGVLLACVGIFPVDDFMTAHNISAVGMVVIFVTLIVTLRNLLPGAPKVFLLLGYVYVGIIVLIAIAFITGYYNLTAVEIIAGVLVFSWILSFLRNTDAIAAADSDSGR